MRDSAIDVAGTKLGYREAGAGATVLFLHGAGGRGMGSVARCAGRADTGAGAGASRLRALGDSGLDDECRRPGVLLSRPDGGAGLRNVHLVGHCLGGWIAAEIADPQTARLGIAALLAPAGVEKGEPFDESSSGRRRSSRAGNSTIQAGAGMACRRRPSSTSTSRCRTAPRWRGSAGTRAGYNRNCPIGCTASMFRHCWSGARTIR